jgi:hypothetical protein
MKKPANAMHYFGLDCEMLEFFKYYKEQLLTLRIFGARFGGLDGFLYEAAQNEIFSNIQGPLKSGTCTIKQPKLWHTVLLISAGIRAEEAHIPPGLVSWHSWHTVINFNWNQGWRGTYSTWPGLLTLLTHCAINFSWNQGW